METVPAIHNIEVRTTSSSRLARKASHSSSSSEYVLARLLCGIEWSRKNS